MTETSDDDAPVRQRPRWGVARVRAYFKRKRALIILRTLVALFVIVACWPYFTIVIPAGKVGVIFRPLFDGTAVARPMNEGLNFILPWNRVTLYDARVQVRKTEFEAVTTEGLHIHLGVIYRYRLHASTAGRLHKAIGPNYTHVLLDPAINAVVRMETSRYSADQVYGDRRGELQSSIYHGVVDPRNHNLIEGGSDPSATDEVFGLPALLSRGGKVHEGYVPLVELVDILITEVRLPDRVREAIEKKEEQQQVQQEYVFRIEREKLESERKRVEAEGIRNFQQTVQAGISENYLRWRGIEATLRLATSPNSKTVIIGSGRTGMPLILNTDDGRSSPSGDVPHQKSSGKPARSRAVANDSMDLTASTDQGSLGDGEAPEKTRSRK